MFLGEGGWYQLEILGYVIFHLVRLGHVGEIKRVNARLDEAGSAGDW